MSVTSCNDVIAEDWTPRSQFALYVTHIFGRNRKSPVNETLINVLYPEIRWFLRQAEHAPWNYI